MSIAENIAKIRERMAAAARRAGRDADAITLMAVSKTFPVQAIREAYAAGIRVFGENRVQEFSTKTDGVRDLDDARWHMIGHLQSNKATKATEIFHAIDSVDSVKLAQRLNDAAGAAAKNLSMLVEVNVGGEIAKSGVMPDSPELDRLLAAAERFEHLEIRGLMTIPPYSEDPEAARLYFRKLRELRERIAASNLPAISMETLSMGMSHDFEVAIEEGSTCVRVGTAIFGERAKA